MNKIKDLEHIFQNFRNIPHYSHVRYSEILFKYFLFYNNV